VHFINVGQGDSILLDLGETEILIDGGGRSPGIVTYLKKHVNGTLEVMVATHPHPDHIGGLTAVLDSFEVKEIWLNGSASASRTFNEFMMRVDSEGAKVTRAERGSVIDAGKLQFPILNPPKQLFKNANDNSIVLSLSYGEVDFLFTGDAEKEAVASMLMQSVVPIPDVEIMKLGHHGSRGSSPPAFLQAVRPEVAIYMVQADNRHGLPHTETIEALNRIGAKIYGTETHGTIIITTDGVTYSIQHEGE
jgi:beta-lactamase superfamily II metal-dependent hydrolase